MDTPKITSLRAIEKNSSKKQQTMQEVAVAPIVIEMMSCMLIEMM